MKTLLVVLLAFQVHAQDLKNGESVEIKFGDSYSTMGLTCTIRKAYIGKIETEIRYNGSLTCTNPISLFRQKAEMGSVFKKQMSIATLDFPNFKNEFSCTESQSETTESTCGVAIWQQHGDKIVTNKCVSKSGGSKSVCLSLQVCQSAALNLAETRAQKYPATADTIQSDIVEAQKNMNALWNRFGCQ